jgi:hypothetical protein
MPTRAYKHSAVKSGSQSWIRYRFRAKNPSIAFLSFRAILAANIFPSDELAVPSQDCSGVIRMAISRSSQLPTFSARTAKRHR